MPPGCAIPSSRAAMLTPSPKMSPSSIMMSPMWMPMRISMRWSGARPHCASPSLAGSGAQRVASTALPNSTSIPSPVRLTNGHDVPRSLAPRNHGGGIQARERALLVGSHHPAIADNIGRKDGGKTALDVLFCHSERSCLGYCVHFMAGGAGCLSRATTVGGHAGHFEFAPHIFRFSPAIRRIVATLRTGSILNAPEPASNAAPKCH